MVISCYIPHRPSISPCSCLMCACLAYKLYQFSKYIQYAHILLYSYNLDDHLTYPIHRMWLPRSPQVPRHPAPSGISSPRCAIKRSFPRAMTVVDLAGHRRVGDLEVMGKHHGKHHPFHGGLRFLKKVFSIMGKRENVWTYSPAIISVTFLTRCSIFFGVAAEV